MSIKTEAVSELSKIEAKIIAGERISVEDAVTLYRTPDLTFVGNLARFARERANGHCTTFIHNRYINYSNLCVLRCQFCAFGARKRDAHAFELSIDEIVRRAEEGLADGITEIHMVGGLHPTLKGEWYLEMLSRLRALDSALHIKAFTAIEIRHLAFRIFKKGLQETLMLLRDYGLDSLTGGGAEIFDQEIRDQLCRGKETAEEWKEVHRAWHQLGQRSTCTMLFGHIESYEQRVDHLRQLRELQDETSGFTGFVPFAFIPQTTILSHIPQTSSEEQLRNLAVSRIFLDNIPHITAYWVSLGLDLTQRSLSFGADDIHGTMVEEQVLHMAGAQTPTQMTQERLIKLIRESGYMPAQRDSSYQVIRNFGTDAARKTERNLAAHTA